MRCRVVPFLLVVAAAAACSTDSVAPVAPAVAPSFATKAASATTSGRYIALMKANAIAADFATTRSILQGADLAVAGSGAADARRCPQP